jgi:hypothetical protein
VLGPSITGAVTPFAFGYSLFARTRARNRPLSYTALILCALEILVIAAFIIGAVIQAA